MSLLFITTLWLTLTNTIITTNTLFKHGIAPIRPSIIEEHHNKNRMLLSFSSDCCQSIRTVKHYIKSFQSLYPCLSTNINEIYKENKGDYHVYLSIKYTNKILNISCIDNKFINWNDFCLNFIDYELQFEQASISNTNPNQDIATCNPINSHHNDEYLWHLDYIDSIIDSKYTYINNTNEYKNIDIFILDESIQSTHIEFNSINYYKFDPFYNEYPMSEHGTHITAIIVGQNVGITQGSLNIPIYDYPICRYSNNGCSFELLEKGLIKIISFIKENNNVNNQKRVIIYLGIQTNGLPLQKWIDILDDLFQQIIEFGGIIIASAGSKNINGCYSYPGGSEYVISVSGYKNTFEIFGNYGNCVDFYAPGSNIYSADIGAINNKYKRLKGTSMSAAIVTGLIANMLWVNNQLTVQQIKSILKKSYHNYNVIPTDQSKCEINGCHLLHWNCDAYNHINPTIVPTFIPTNMPVYSPTNQPTNNPTQSPEILKDIMCLLPQNIKPCECFIDYEICIDINKCEWDMNEFKCIEYIPNILTDLPTYIPTKNPQMSPTNIPTQTPHISPTNIPTNNPQYPPTIMPTYNPLRSPSNIPTYNPQMSPTNIPISPTNIPTNNPLHSSTFNPQKPPTNIPTNVPTNNPHISPTNSPTYNPQLLLTNSPTNNPHVSPTHMPTNTPIITLRPIVPPIDTSCSLRKSVCNANNQCCSKICVRFQGVSHCF